MERKLSTFGIAATVAVIALTGAACSNNSSSKSSSSSSATTSSSTAGTTSAAAAATDYTALLIKPEDIVIPGDTFTGEPPQLNPAGSEGVAAGFRNADETRAIGDTIMILPDPEAAKTAMDGAVKALDQSIANPSPEPAQVGDNGVIGSGTSPDGSKAVTVVTFSQGKGFVVLQFDSPAGDPVPTDFATSLAQKQADNIKAGLS
ncbi:MAG TPA: hypothetical protein VIJ23_04810 [Mycobacterium sp.]